MFETLWESAQWFVFLGGIGILVYAMMVGGA